MPQGPQKELVDIWILDPFNRVIKNGKSGGMVLFASTFLALFIANSALAEAYHHLWEMKFTIGFHEFIISKSLHHWINDGLMAMFFFVVGLELKRELVAGELKDPKNALLPIVAALGGMVLPALIYALMNPGPIERGGWGIPMATDIAFALGVLYLLGDRVPTSLKIFLTAIAIVDDLGAVLVIAFFYTSDVSLFSLGLGAIVLAVMIGGNLIGIRNSLFYGILGIGGLWLAFLLSGVHATIAAVLAAFTIPASTSISEPFFSKKSKELVKQFEESESDDLVTVSDEQYYALEKLQTLSREAIPPLQRLEHGLHPMVAFIVLPIFALSNAGVSLTGDILESLSSNVTLGIIAGLLGGKVLGIFGLSYLLVRFNLVSLPSGMRMQHVLGISFMAAIGFTMSMFIAGLAFTEPIMLEKAKLGILLASLMASVLGYFTIKSTLKA